MSSDEIVRKQPGTRRLVIGGILQHWPPWRPTSRLFYMEFDEAAVLRAVERGSLEDLRAMVASDRALALRAEDADGCSSFAIACWKGHTDMVEYLLGVPGVEVNRANNSGATPLDLAMSGPCMGVVKLLLAAAPGINPGIDDGGHTDDGAAPPLVAHEDIVRPAGYLRDVHVAGGINKYRGEPRLQMVLLRELSQQGRASVINDRTTEETRLSELFTAAHTAHSDAALLFAATAFHPSASATSSVFNTMTARAANAAAAAASATEALAKAVELAKRRRLYEWLFVAPPPSLPQTQDGGCGAAARAEPRRRLLARPPGGLSPPRCAAEASGIPGDVGSGPLRLIVAFWWSP